jgi:cytochrome bd-type quinol oxidase subunit 2
LVTLTLGLLLLVTMPIMPFTEQYARERVPREYWGRPVFKKVNRVLSLAWAAAIMIIGLASMAVALLHERAGSKSDTNPLDLILNWVVTIAILVFTVRFTAIYPDRARKAAGVAEEPQPQPTDAPRRPSTSA